MIDLVRSNLAEIEALCRRHKVRRLFLVGSAVDGTSFDEARSDVDFLVEFEPQERKGWDDVYFQLLEELERVLGRKVDLIEAKALRNPYLIASINRTKKMLYAA